jgi:hypothetical protein
MKAVRHPRPESAKFSAIRDTSSLGTGNGTVLSWSIPGAIDYMSGGEEKGRDDTAGTKPYNHAARNQSAYSNLPHSGRNIVSQPRQRRRLAVSSKWLGRSSACWDPRTDLTPNNDVYFWLNTDIGDQDVEGCVSSAIRLRSACGWSIVVQNIETGEETTLSEADREFRTFRGGVPVECAGDGDNEHWHRFGPVKLSGGHYEVAYENVGASHSKWFVGPVVAAMGPLGDCNAPYPSFRDQRYAAAAIKGATFIGKYEQKRIGDASRSDYFFMYKVPLAGDVEPRNAVVVDVCKSIAMKPLCSTSSDVPQNADDPMCVYVRPDPVTWSKIFDGECGGGEIRMYEDSTDNPGTDEASRAKACADACLAKKNPLSGSWVNFDAVGFIVFNDGGNNDGRCYCEKDDSVSCTRTSNSYDRYDFNGLHAWSDPTTFEYAWPDAPDGTAERFYGTALYALGDSGNTRYNDGITKQRWTPSDKRGGSTVCVSAQAMSSQREFFVENVFSFHRSRTLTTAPAWNRTTRPATM